MAASSETSREVANRVRLVEEHVRMENDHDLEGVLETFGEAPRYEDESWGAMYDGIGGVREYYESLLTALPDFQIDVQNRHVTDDEIVLEVVISGTHKGYYHGLPPTGRHVSFPLCAVYSFDDAGKLASERIYYDRATVFRQVGVFHEPDGIRGQLLTRCPTPSPSAGHSFGREWSAAALS
ncbi:ester cyclase [Natrinema sp. 1APR25-10V2]|uniref:ester cyclase n=1 Tax=Natrinema sp. 1APR25-10V2 TaxID=2951081 RepID=UPI00287B6127|nr:ester cyclase [Natrinema sp. 1APR25-10V2]